MEIFFLNYRNVLKKILYKCFFGCKNCNKKIEKVIENI